MGRNNEDFSQGNSEKEYSLEYEPQSKYLGHTITAKFQGKEVGSLEWGTPGEHNTPTVGKVAYVTVDPEHRRKGLATKMYLHAKNIASITPGVPAPKHSTDRSPEGDLWASSTGESVSRKNKYGKE